MKKIDIDQEILEEKDHYWCWSFIINTSKSKNKDRNKKRKTAAEIDTKTETDTKTSTDTETETETETEINAKTNAETETNAEVEAKTEVLQILHIEIVQRCVLCNEIMQKKTLEVHPYCTIHGAEEYWHDLFIYYTVTDLIEVREKKEGWKRRTGEEVRSGRYGLHIKVDKEQALREQHILNLFTLGEFKRMLEAIETGVEGKSIYAVCLHDIIEALWL